MALFGLALLFGAGSARAEEGAKAGEKMPLPFAERPLTLPRMTLAPEVSLDVAHVALGGLGSATSAGMEIGAHFGILDDLEVGAVVLPLEFSPDFAYGNPRLEATFRFLKGTVEMGARLRTLFGIHSGNTGVVIEPGLPILIHIGEAARIDTGVFVPMAFGTSPGDLPAQSNTTIGLNIPFQFIYDVVPEFHIGVNTGFGIYDFAHAGDEIYIPLGFVVGYAIGNEKGPLVDIDPYFKLPLFARPGTGSGQDNIFTGIWQTGIAATVYLYL